jgi:hypothetical protein
MTVDVGRGVGIALGFPLLRQTTGCLDAGLAAGFDCCGIVRHFAREFDEQPASIAIPYHHMKHNEGRGREHDASYIAPGARMGRSGFVFVVCDILPSTFQKYFDK